MGPRTPRILPSVRVSDRALIRFVERIGGLDVEALRQHLEGSLNRAVSAAGAIGGDRLTVVADGHRYVIVGGVVVTVLGPSKSPRSPKR